VGVHNLGQISSPNNFALGNRAILWDQALHTISKLLFKISTGEPHPAAKESTIHVFNSRWDMPGIDIQIVGDLLVLILSYRHNHWTADDLVFVYDWRNAVQTMVGPLINSFQ
jgi:hypothetical protein